ncbi:MAG: class I SAM-dependent methyltransferase [Actinomycetota bacterium]|nr:class I SAM-dependent methyltransferase [Actinomycetota bacterium]
MPSHFSFEAVDALDYDELRPSYAPEAIAWVAERGSLRPGSTVVDLAAGTGQLSRRLADLGMDLVAVEPAPNMRTVLEERYPWSESSTERLRRSRSRTARWMP